MPFQIRIWAYPNGYRFIHFDPIISVAPTNIGGDI